MRTHMEKIGAVKKTLNLYSSHPVKMFFCNFVQRKVLLQ